MRLYFGNTVTTVTTVLLLGLIAFWVFTIMTRKDIEYWGLKSLFLLIYGLVICCFAATRDGFDKTVQCAIDGSVAPGIFSLVSLPTIIGCIGALVIIVAAIATPIAKLQSTREIWFYIMSGGVSLKVITVELARIFL